MHYLKGLLGEYSTWYAALTLFALVRGHDPSAPWVQQTAEAVAALFGVAGLVTRDSHNPTGLLVQGLGVLLRGRQ
jgi:hypothetical protein